MTTEHMLTVTILHSLPGRLRTCVSHHPRDIQTFDAHIREHEGIHSTVYTPATRSVLISYNVHEVKEHEIIIRIALSLSMEHGVGAVKIMGIADRQPFSISSAYSGFVLVLSLLLTMLKSPMNRQSQFIAAGATALAVFDHAWHEIKTRGYFDPEVASIGYLAAGLLRGRPMQAAAFTWFATFGRHFFEVSRPGVIIQPVKYRSKDGAAPDYRVIVSTGSKISPAMRFIKLTADMLKTASEGGAGNLLDEIRKVSNAHGQVLDGISWMPQGIPIEFQ